MKNNIIHVFGALVVFFALVFMTPAFSFGQDTKTGDTTAVVEQSEESSAFQDSVQFDDMDPIFYEAEADEPEIAQKSKGMSMATIVGIIVVVLGIIIVLIKKFTIKRS